MRREALLVASWDHDEHVCCETSSRLEVRCIGLAIQCRCVRGGSWRREMDFSYQSKRASVRGWHVDSIEGTRRSSPTTLLLDYLITRLLSCSPALSSSFLYIILKAKSFFQLAFLFSKYPRVRLSILASKRTSVTILVSRYIGPTHCCYFCSCCCWFSSPYEQYL
jgi:hypothetical protein